MRISNRHNPTVDQPIPAEEPGNLDELGVPLEGILLLEIFHDISVQEVVAHHPGDRGGLECDEIST